MEMENGGGMEAWRSIESVADGRPGVTVRLRGEKGTWTVE